MAEGVRFVCDKCGHVKEAWSDGNPYYLDPSGRKEYAYHPDHEGLAKCIGNDTPHLCLACGKEFNVDSRSPRTDCPHCQSDDIADSFQLNGRRCPQCKAGSFYQDPDYMCVS